MGRSVNDQTQMSSLGGHLRKVPNIVIWLEKVCFFGKLVMEEMWSRLTWGSPNWRFSSTVFEYWNFGFFSHIWPQLIISSFPHFTLTKPFNKHIESESMLVIPTCNCPRAVSLTSICPLVFSREPKASIIEILTASVGHVLFLYVLAYALTWALKRALWWTQ